MTDREQIEVVTPVGGDKVALKKWLTGREKRNIRSVLLEGVNFSADNEDENTDPKYSVSGSVIDKAQDATITNVVISINGEESDVLNKILDMREEDFEFVIEEINKISGGLSEKDKKK